METEETKTAPLTPYGKDGFKEAEVVVKKRRFISNYADKKSSVYRGVKL